MSLSIRTKETETPRRRAYRHAHLESARRRDKVVYARKKVDSAWMDNRKAVAFRERLDLKIAVLSYYGPDGRLECCWPGCTVVDVDMLTLDHVANNGATDRKIAKCGCGVALYRRLRRDGYPVGFQTLCSNHQLKKKIEFERTHV